MKQRSIMQVIDMIEDGMLLGFGGNVLHRSPNAVAHMIATSKLLKVSVVKTAIAFEADVLSAYKKLDTLHAGFVSYESEFGLANYFRKAVESGEVKFEEHACYSVIMGLRAASLGIPFIPIKGFEGSDVVKHTNKKEVVDPYTGKSVLTIKAIKPDFVFIHVPYADTIGNCWIDGPLYEDEILARAGKKVIVTCEKIVKSEQMNRIADISSVLVDYVVLLPQGSHPGSCSPFYDIDSSAMLEIKKNVFSYMEEKLEEVNQ